MTYQLLGNDYILDLGIFRNEIDLKGHNDFYYKSVVDDQGDLSTFYGYETFDATGYTIVPPKAASMGNQQNPKNLLQQGIAYVKTVLPDTGFSVDEPVHKANLTFKLGSFKLQPGVNPTFFLEKEGKITHAVINGFLLDLSKPLEEQKFGNALIYR